MMIDALMWLVVAAAIVGTVANARKLRWCFPVWAVTNVVQACHCASKGAWPTAALMLVYFFLAIYGWRSWGRTSRPTVGAPPEQGREAGHKGISTPSHGEGDGGRGSMTEPRENTHACIERAVAEFGVHMKHKLLLTRRRPHWEGCSMAMLLERLREEADELEAAIATGDRKAVVREAADCANFAMMIADNAQWAGTRAWNSHEGE